MKISKTSWHWRVFLNWERRKKRTHAFTYERPVNLSLCRYFWTVMFFAPLRWLFQREGKVPPFVVAFGAVILSGWAYICFDAFTDAWYLVFIPALGPILVVALLLGVILLLEWLADRRRDKRFKRNTSGGKRVKEPGLLSSYIAAKKNKVCPILEIEDD